MNRLGPRINRLWKTTHTFVTGEELKIIAEYLDKPVNPAYREPDYEKLLSILKEKGDGYRGLFKADVLKFRDYDNETAEKQRRQVANKMVQRFPNGTWVANNFERFFKLLDEANHWGSGS